VDPHRREAAPLGADGKTPQSPWPTSSSRHLNQLVLESAAQRHPVAGHAKTIATCISRCATECGADVRQCHWVLMGGNSLINALNE